MRKIFASLLVLLFLLPFSVFTFQTKSGNVSLNSTEREIIQFTNDQRKKNKLAALTANATLMSMARSYAKLMADKNTLSHDLGGGFENRMKKSSYKAKEVGENIAMGRLTSSGVVDMWMKSKLHKDNILNRNFTEIGVGFYKAKNGDIYFCQIFGKR
jgi:uncharacterized protein YkwD